MSWLRRIFGSSPDPERAREAAERAARVNHPSVGRSTSRRVRPEKTEPDWRSYDWDDVARDYARIVAPMTTEPYAELLSLAGADADSLVLDVGTGTGAELVNAPGVALGVDVSLKFLAEGRAADPAARLAGADIIDLPFADATFDIVSANFTLPYVTTLDTALFDMIRVLKPGGVIAVTTWTDIGDDLTNTWLTLATERLGPELMRDALKQGTPWADRVGSAKHLEQVLRDAKLRPVEVTKRRYRYELSREDYVTGRSVEVVGRYLHRMLGEERWPAFLDHARATFASSFGETVVDFRDVLLAVGTKPR